MRYRKLDAKGDMQGQRGDNFYFDNEAIAAAIRSRLLLFKGEWWEDPEEGIPFEILTGRMEQERQQIADAFIKERISETEGVNQIMNYHSIFKNKQRQINVEVLTIYSDVVSVEVRL